MKKVIYRLHWYNTFQNPHKFILREENGITFMGWSRFIDLCMDSLLQSFLPVDDKLRIDNTWEQIFIDMDRLRDKNFDLYNKTMFYINECDDLWVTPARINELLDELEDFCCAKVVSTK
jgi:hypothetical protein